MWAHLFVDMDRQSAIRTLPRGHAKVNVGFRSMDRLALLNSDSLKDHADDGRDVPRLRSRWARTWP